MQRLNVEVRGRLLPEMRINGKRIYLDPIKEPDLNPDSIDEMERVDLPPLRRRSLTRWNP